MFVLNPYLNFNGNAEQAFNFYKSVFGGEFSALMRMGEAPGMPYELNDADKQKIMHIALPIGRGNTLMASDVLESAGHPPAQGNNVYMGINTMDEAEARRLFDGLSVNAQIEMPLTDMFWGALFASFTDQFGIKWMINCERPAQQST